jgi:hypothetical protein
MPMRPAVAAIDRVVDRRGQVLPREPEIGVGDAM